MRNMCRKNSNFGFNKSFSVKKGLMNELEINYSISKNIQLTGIISGAYLFGISSGVAIFQALAKNYTFFFYAGLVGAVIGVILILSVTTWQSKPVITIDNDQFRVHLPKQRINGVIDWVNVTQIGIGLSYITMATNENKNYKIDLENLKYTDLRAIKTKLIEVSEAKGIPYYNL